MNKEEDGIWHEVLHRDKGYCQYCGADLLAGPVAFFSATVDLVLPKRAGGGFTVENLVLCCKGCNGILSRQKHLQTFQQRRAHVRKTLLDGLPPRSADQQETPVVFGRAYERPAVSYGRRNRNSDKAGTPAIFPRGRGRGALNSG
jgi:hypothetical protein